MNPFEGMDNPGSAQWVAIQAVLGEMRERGVAMGSKTTTMAVLGAYAGLCGAVSGVDAMVEWLENYPRVANRVKQGDQGLRLALSHVFESCGTVALHPTTKGGDGYGVQKCVQPFEMLRNTKIGNTKSGAYAEQCVAKSLRTLPVFYLPSDEESWVRLAEQTIWELYFGETGVLSSVSHLMKEQPWGMQQDSRNTSLSAKNDTDSVGEYFRVALPLQRSPQLVGRALVLTPLALESTQAARMFMYGENRPEAHTNLTQKAGNNDTERGMSSSNPSYRGSPVESYRTLFRRRSTSRSTGTSPSAGLYDILILPYTVLAELARKFQGSHNLHCPASSYGSRGNTHAGFPLPIEQMLCTLLRHAPQVWCLTLQEEMILRSAFQAGAPRTTLESVLRVTQSLSRLGSRAGLFCGFVQGKNVSRLEKELKTRELNCDIV